MPNGGISGPGDPATIAYTGMEICAVEGVGADMRVYGLGAFG